MKIMTYITYSDIEKRNIIIHRLPCEKIGNLHEELDKWQEFSDLDYAEQYAKEKNLNICYCELCNSDINKIPSVEYIKKFCSSNDFTWINNYWKTFENERTFSEYEFSQKTAFIFADEVLPAICTLSFRKSIGWIFRIDFYIKDISAYDKNLYVSLKINNYELIVALSPRLVDENDNLMIAGFEISENANAELLSDLLTDIFKCDNKQIYILVKPYYGEFDFAVLPLKAGLNEEIDISLNAMYARLNQHLYDRLEGEILQTPEISKFFQNLTLYNACDKLTEAVLLSTGIKVQKNATNTKFVHAEENLNIDFLQFLQTKNKLAYKDDLLCIDLCIENLISFDCSSLFTNSILELAFFRREHYRTGNPIDYNTLIERMNNPSPIFYNPKAWRI